MKKIKSMLAIAFCGLMLASCSKEEAVVNTKEQPTNQHSTPQYLVADGTRYWKDNKKVPGVEFVDFGCFAGAGTCADDYQLDGIMVDQTGDIIDEILLNDPSHTQQVFVDNETFLKGIFPNNYVDQVISGQITVKYRGMYESGQTSYFTFIEGSEIIFVQPIIK